MTRSREQFESRYPIPQGVEWSEEEGRYRPVDGKYVTGFSFRQYEAYIAAWGVWKASRQAVVVELPERGAPMFDAGVEQCKASIEAAGLRCEVKA